jgi:hypothetical protein
MRVGESTGDIVQYAQALLERNATLSDAHAQRLTRHERHRVEREATDGLAGSKYRYDVWFLECGGESELPGESCRRESVRELRRQHFHDDVPAEYFVARDEHAGHPTAAQLRFHRVAAPERLLELFEEIVQGFLGAGSQMYAGRAGFAPCL